MKAKLVSFLIFAFLVTGIAMATLGPNHVPLIPDEVRNLSCRTTLAPGGMATAGFIVDSPRGALLLIRAAGPELANFDVSNPMTDPQIAIFNRSRKLLENQDWMDNDAESIFRSATTRGGAFPFSENSKDAGIVVWAAPGSYTVQATSADGQGGEVLIEVYRLHPSYSDYIGQTWADLVHIGQDE